MSGFGQRCNIIQQRDAVNLTANECIGSYMYTRYRKTKAPTHGIVSGGVWLLSGSEMLLPAVLMFAPGVAIAATGASLKRLGFVYLDLTAVDFLAVVELDGFQRVGWGLHLHKGKATRLI